MRRHLNPAADSKQRASCRMTKKRNHLLHVPPLQRAHKGDQSPSELCLLSSSSRLVAVTSESLLPFIMMTKKKKKVQALSRLLCTWATPCCLQLTHTPRGKYFVLTPVGIQQRGTGGKRKQHLINFHLHWRRCVSIMSLCAA